MTEAAARQIAAVAIQKGIAKLADRIPRGRPRVLGPKHYLAKRRAKRDAFRAQGLTIYGKPRVVKRRFELEHLQGRDKINAYKRLWYSENSERVNHERKRTKTS